MVCIGWDIGGTKCAAVLGETESGNISVLHRAETPTKQSPEETLAALDGAVTEWMHTYKAECGGISCGGPLDSATGTIISPPNLPGWHGFAIAPYLSEKYSLPVRLENDANACAVAEWKYGAGKGTRNMIFLTFGTGIGAGLILDGKLYGGTNGNAGEIGHVRLANKGPVGFGKAGSFEGFCSGGGIARLAVEAAARRKQLPACITAMGGMEKVTAKELSKAAFAGDKFALGVYRKSGKMLGRGLSILIDTLNPERIVLGGVFMRSAQLLVPSMQAEIAKESLAVSADVCTVVPAALGEAIGDIAALSVAE